MVGPDDRHNRQAQPHRRSAKSRVIQCASSEVVEERVAFLRKGFRLRLKLAAQLLFEPLPRKAS
jgi:hypothetical protein